MPKTVLLADDSITIQKVVGISFANEDVKLVNVDNGEAAVAKARELRPDLVLADVVMPGLSGYEVCEALKQDPALRHIPVLLLTGTFEAFDEERARRSGAAGHVAKPFEAQTLVDQVKRLLAAGPARPGAPPPAPPARTPLQAPAASPRPASPPGAAPARPKSPPAPAARPAAPPAARPAAAPPARPGAPPAAEARRILPSPAPSAEEAFDFFEETGGGLAAEPGFAAAGPAGALPFEGENEGFSFGDEELGSLEAESMPELETPVRRPGRAPDATLAILPEPEPFQRTAGGRELVLEAEPEEAEGDPRGLAPLAAELLDDDTGPIARTAEEDDPFDPDSLGSLPFESAGRGLGDQATELFDLGTAEEDGGAAPFLRAQDADLAKATLLDPDRATGFDVSASDLGDPFGAPGTRSSSRGPRPAPQPEARAPRPASGAASQELLRELVPALREPLHDTLEKIAWESFGSMAEEIVRRAIERMEAVAWEVIPQMAETLIREELRRIKGEGEDSGY